MTTNNTNIDTAIEVQEAQGSFKNVVTISAGIEKIETLKDNSVKLTVMTQELLPQKAGQLFALKGAVGFLAFKLEPFAKDELTALEETSADLTITPEKSPSKRLRNVLFRVWEHNETGYSDFNLYYIKIINKLIQRYKDNLP